MSELTPCNHCSLENIRYRAKKKGWNVTIKLDRYGWTDVYVHPPSVTDFPDHGHDDEWSQYQVASMMKITDHCVC